MPAAAQDSRFADPAAIDAEVSAFTGAPLGTPGGARHPVDRRLRLAACAQSLDLAWHGRRADMVRVECNAGTSWRIFVPVNGDGANQTPAAAPVPVVERGQVIGIVIEGRGFSVAQQGEALEDGAIGQWIRVRPEGQREALRARIETPGRAVIPLG
ncbi:MAG: flagella basal body P-ring formation protein FlgA [Erythrobacter sp.]|nr:MAG: flagella basal body P-ring formation protein FlgA [Erythrobacter sp.]